MSLIFCGDYTVDNTVGALTNAPTAFDLSFCGNILWNNVDQYGAQILVKNAGGTRLPCQVQLFNPIAKTGWIWVKIDTVAASPTDTTVKLYLDTTQTVFTQTVTALTLTNNATTNSTTGWTATVGGLISQTTSPTPNVGTGYLAGGNNAVTTAYQDISVSAYASQIDGAGLLYRHFWYQAGAGAGDTDTGELQLEFLDNGGATLFGPLAAGPINIASTTWAIREQCRRITPLTRTIRVWYHGIRNSGTPLNVYINDIVPSLLDFDPYGQVNVWNDYELVGLGGSAGGQTANGIQQGLIDSGDPQTFTLSATSGDTNSGRGLCYDQTTYWYGTDNTSAALRKYSAIATPTVVTTNSNVLADSGVASATGIGAPEYFGTNVYAPVWSASAGWVTLWDTGCAFVSKFDVSAKTILPIACCVVPANTGWGASDRLFVAASNDATQLWEYTTAGSFVAAFPLNRSVSSITGLTYFRGRIFIAGSGAEVYTATSEGNVSAAISSTQVLSSGGLFPAVPSAGNYTGLGHSKDAIYYTNDNGATETTETWVSYSLSLSGGGGLSVPSSGAEGMRFTGLQHLSTFTIGVNGELANKATTNKTLLSYANEASNATNARVSILWRVASTVMALWDNVNTFLNTALNPTLDLAVRYNVYYNGTTERAIITTGTTKVTSVPAAIPSNLDMILLGYEDQSGAEIWIGRGSWWYLRSGVLTADWMQWETDMFSHVTFAETALNLTSTATIVPTGSVALALTDTLTSTATIVPTGSVVLGLIEGLTSTKTVVPTGAVVLSLIESLSSVAIIAPTGAVTFGAFTTVNEISSVATVAPDSAYTAFRRGAEPGPQPYVVRVHDFSQTVGIVETSLVVSVGPMDHPVRRVR